MSKNHQHKHSYIAHQPNQQGIIDYAKEENAVWEELMVRQLPIVQNRGCPEYLRGLEILDFPTSRIPQLSEVSGKLMQATGWSVTPVPALISHSDFFQLLSKRQFPAATFIRRPEDIDYLEEPDIFHEFFGHCPMLTDPVYADFMQKFGLLGSRASTKNQALLARLYWFTVEFGLINTPQGMRIYGGGILSSCSETLYALESALPERKPFEPLDVLCTPYRIDIKQTIYYVIPSFNAVYELLHQDIAKLIDQALLLGEYPPTFPVSDGIPIY